MMSKSLATVAVVWALAVSGAGWSAERPRLTAGLTQPALPAQALRQQAPSPGAGAAPSPARAVVDKYCVSCHSARLKAGDLVLETLVADPVAGHAEVWEKVIHKLQTREMPPAGLPRPDEATYTATIAHLAETLDRAAQATPNPGRVPVRRLNRAEYTNAIRDLLDLEVDGTALLPADNVTDGFDNMAGALTLSPSLLERYLSAARRVSRLAVGDPTIGAGYTSRMYEVSLMRFQKDRMSEDLPFGSRGGLAVRHVFPLDGEYAIKVTLQRNLYGYLRGLDEPQELEIRLDGKRVKVFPLADRDLGKGVAESFLGIMNFGAGSTKEFDAYMLTADGKLEVRLPATAGVHLVSASFVKTPWEMEGVLQPDHTGYPLSNDSTTTSPDGLANAAVATMTVSGPFSPTGAGDTPSRRRLFACRPAEAAAEAPCARQILSTLARRAFRRPVANGDVDALMASYTAERSARGFEGGIQAALEQLLVDPEFLFRIERDPARATAGVAYPVTDLELASRLSLFLWSSIPDDELLEVAARGRLREAATLEQQVKRMLADRRARALVDNFAAQWLLLPLLKATLPNPELFPEFDENLREAFLQETQLFVETQIREDRPVLESLTADYTFANERLARHYGIPGVYGTRFRRVALPNPDQRGGLLGHGGILTATSEVTRTSPVKRGRWMLENIFGGPPPEPPPNVPGLEEGTENARRRSLREQMEQHRKNPVCAGCHVRMDQFGFALENFDPIGRWRDHTEGGAPIDAAVALPDGTTFTGFAGVRQFAVSHRDQYVTTVTERLLTYALGRSLEYYDKPGIRQIVRQARAQGDRWSAIVLGIVRSTPFQMRRADS